MHEGEVIAAGPWQGTAAGEEGANYTGSLGHWKQYCEQTPREFAPSVEIEFCRLAVTRDQVEACCLPSRPARVSDTRAKRWGGGDSVELDAIEANQLRALCEGWIEALIPDGWLASVEAAEKSERSFLATWAKIASEAWQ